MQRGQCLGRDLGKQQDDDGQHHAGREDEACIVIDAQCDQRHQDGGEDVDEVVAEQDQPDQAVLAFQQFLRAQGAGMFFVGQVAQAIAVQRHQAGFGTGEKGGQQYQEEQRRKQHA